MRGEDENSMMLRNLTFSLLTFSRVEVSFTIYQEKVPSLSKGKEEGERQGREAGKGVG